MKQALTVLALTALVAGAIVAGLGTRPDSGFPPAPSDFTPLEVERLLQHSPLGAPPRDSTNSVFENPAAARLGQRLFFDPGFSREGTVSCATRRGTSRRAG